MAEEAEGMDARGAVRVVAAEESLVAGWLRLRRALWPGCLEEESLREMRGQLASGREAAFVAVDGVGEVVGFAECSLRPYADGCGTSPVGYLEGIYVAPPWRESGLGRALAGACEAWAVSRGCTEMGSDTPVENTSSQAFHRALGYRESARLVTFAKVL